MHRAAFKENKELTGLIKNRLAKDGVKGAGRILIGRKIGEGAYSTAYRYRQKRASQIIRLFKRLGLKDRMPNKALNIQAERDALDKLKQAGVNQALAPVLLRVIEYTSRLFPNEPIKFGVGRDKREIVGYQVCNLIKGQALSSIHKRRSDPEFVRAIGDHLGRIIADFHHAAREVDFPLYTTPEDLDKRDHAYRMVTQAVTLSQKAGETDESRLVHYELAQQINRDVVPLFQSTANRTIRIHGNLVAGNIIMKGRKISGIIDLDKALQGFAGYDLIAAALIPGMLDAAVHAYDQRMSSLSGTETRLDRALILKFALALQTKVVNGSSEQKVIDRGIVAMSIILDQLAKIEPDKYGAHARAIRPQAQIREARYPGIRHQVA